MRTKLIRKGIVAIALSVFVPLLANAGPGSREPRRIYDIGSRNIIDNPDYREPAPRKPAVRSDRRSKEPQRVYSIQSQQFEDNPKYDKRADTARTGRVPE